MQIRLHGGPAHNESLAIPDGYDHFHITVMERDREAGTYRTREGVYSQVRDRPGDFEWDGFISHDDK